ncbi:hypothetical protein O3P69_008012 [Scylla paramamosain]|uniref:Uncharacterized protein n=1 Tax=Scylla paramamosain TaxID=85552 RepID=A0AAW0SZA8_SCYPA
MDLNPGFPKCNGTLLSVTIKHNEDLLQTLLIITTPDTSRVFNLQHYSASLLPLDSLLLTRLLTSTRTTLYNLLREPSIGTTSVVRAGGNVTLECPAAKDTYVLLLEWKCQKCQLPGEAIVPQEVNLVEYRTESVTLFHHEGRMSLSPDTFSLSFKAGARLGLRRVFVPRQQQG